MGSVQEFDQKCPICGKMKYLTDYYYKTHESYGYCEACGFGQSISLMHDDTGAVLTRKAASYPIDGRLKIVTKNLDSGEILQEVAIRADMSADEIYQHLRDKEIDLFYGIYFGDDLEHPCFHYLSQFEMQEVDGVMHFIVSDPIWQLRLDAVNPDGVKIKVRLKQLATPEQCQKGDTNDLYEFTISDEHTGMVNAFAVSTRAMNGYGLLNLILHPEAISTICV